MRNSGFSLVECVAVVAILGVVLGFGVPALTVVVEHRSAASTFHLLTSSLAGARAAAVIRGQPATVCPSEDGRHCRRDLVWEAGWIVFLDPDRSDHPRDADAILQHIQAQSSRLAVRSSAGRHRVRFQPSGWSAGSNLSLRVCRRSDATLLGSVVVNNAGRPRSMGRDTRSSPCPYAP